MFRVTSDPAKNRLCIVLSGHLDDAEREEAARTIREEAGKLTPGSDLINDISELRPTSAEGLKQLAEVQSFLRDHGLRRVIRIAGIALTEIQLERTGREVGYISLSAESVEAAERILDANLHRKSE
jgi:hypothetical protein